MVLPRLRPGTGAILLAVALLAIQAIAVASRSHAQEDVYTVRDIAVDVTADSAAAARDRAIVEAQRKAFDQLLLSLSTPADIARLPPLGDDAISDMVLDFEIESENASTVRYIGKMAFRFRAGPVREYLEQGGVGYAVGATRPALVVPVLTRDGANLLWDEGNDWLRAWSQDSVDQTLVQIAVPLGDLGDIAALDAAQALNGDIAALQGLAQRYGAGDVVVAEAAVAIDQAGDEARLTLEARRYAPSGLVGTMQETLTAPGGEAALPGLYTQAAQRVSTYLQEAWKQENLVSSTGEQHLDVMASFTGLEDWVDLKRRLADVAMVRRADVREISRSRARLDLVYVGSQAQLTRALAQYDLSLVPAPVAPPAPPVPGAAPPAPGALPAPEAAPGPTTAPGTGGAVTVDPGALPAATPTPAQPSAPPLWELRRGGQAGAGTSSPAPATVQPAPPAVAVQPTPPVE